ncbi:MAG: MBL fold metallo-hydrolase [Desulfuromonadaceae bacterium]|nr:MBL fold metallo-hydrolase [Desulfuromonadaceae bacterium]
MRVCQLASGSKGNALYIESGQTRILIDAGLSARRLSAHLQDIGIEAASLDAVFLTHEHVDHTSGLGPLCRRYALPLYCTQQTFSVLEKLGPVKTRFFESGESVVLKDLRVQSFPVTHDAVEPVGFVIEGCEGRVGLATDLGVATRLVQDRLQQCRVLVLETNHDEEMLREGPYPWPLKQRIRSRHGHLSNREGSELLAQLLWPGLEALFLAHLSETNNTPQAAQSCVAHVLTRQNQCCPQVIMGRPDRVSQCFEC